MVDVEHRPLRALQQDVLSAADGLRDDASGVAHVRPQPIAVGEVDVEHVGHRRQRAAERVRDGRPGREVGLEARLEAGPVEEIPEAHAAARGLVFVRRADAPLRRADRARARLGLAQAIDDRMVRQHDVRAIADGEALLRRARREQTAARDLGHLAEQHGGIDDGALRQHAPRARVQHAGWDEVEHHLLAADHEGVTRVRAAPVTHDDVGVLRVEVDDLAFAFVAPLGAHDHHDCHGSTVLRARGRCLGDLKFRARS